MKDIIDLFDVPEKTILAWISEKKMPSYRIKNQYYFNKAEINEWILKNDIAVSEKILDLISENPSITISEISGILQISSRAVEKQIRSLRESGRIKRTGSRKKGSWELL